MMTDLIDPRTFLLVANLLGMFCALVLWVQARSFPADIEGLNAPLRSGMNHDVNTRSAMVL